MNSGNRTSASIITCALLAGTALTFQPTAAADVGAPVSIKMPADRTQASNGLRARPVFPNDRVANLVVERMLRRMDEGRHGTHATARLLKA